METDKHHYPEVFDWIKSGRLEEIQYRGFDWQDNHWEAFYLVGMSEQAAFLRNEWAKGVWTFRLKPRTVSISGVEIEGPVKDPVRGQNYFTFNLDGTISPVEACAEGGILLDKRRRLEDCLVERAFMFSSAEAARTAFNTIMSALLGNLSNDNNDF